MRVLVDSLERLRDAVSTAPNFTSTTYRFGARDLVVRARGLGLEHLPHGGLVPSSGGRAGIPLYLIDAAEAAALAFPSEATLGPYGALVDSVQTEWLVLRNADTGRVLALDTVTRTALYYPGTPVPPRDRAEFCRPLLHWLAILDGNVVVHAGAVVAGDRGLLVAGAGNAGKSTLVRACVEAGLEFLGDNVVEVASGELFAVYPTVKIRPGGVLSMPAGWPATEWDDEAQKHIAFLAEVAGWSTPPEPSQHVATLVLDASAPGEVRPLARSRAFFEVAPNTVAQFPFYEELVLSRTGAVVGAAPTFTAGRLPVDEIPAIVRDLIDVPAGVSGGR